jgi:integrase
VPSYTIIPQTTLRKTQSEAIGKYIKMISVNNSRTGNEYLTRLITFETYIKEHYPFSLDELTINKLFNYRENIYELLAAVSWLSQRIGKDGYKLSNVSIKQRVITAKNFLEFFDIDINPRKFKLKVKMPRVVMQYKEALTKEDIIKILEACGKFKLKTYLLFLAATGCLCVLILYAFEHLPNLQTSLLGH